MSTEPRQITYRLSLQAWLGLLALGLSVWPTRTYAGLLMEILWVLFGSLLVCPPTRAWASAH